MTDDAFQQALDKVTDRLFNAAKAGVPTQEDARQFILGMMYDVGTETAGRLFAAVIRAWPNMEPTFREIAEDEAQRIATDAAVARFEEELAKAEGKP